MTEKELVEKVLRDRAIVKPDNTLDKTRFMKLITEPWIRKKVETYGWLKQPIRDVEKTADLNAENKSVDETLKTVEKVSQIENIAPENEELTNTVLEQVKKVVEEQGLEVVVETEPEHEVVVEETFVPEMEVPVEKLAAENDAEIELTETPVEEKIAEPAPAEDAPAAEEVVEEVVEEPSETPAPKKTSKKKK